MKLLQLVSILLFLSTTLCTIEKSGSVYKLTDSTYDQFISEHEAVFVKIYARTNNKKYKIYFFFLWSS